MDVISKTEDVTKSVHLRAHVNFPAVTFTLIELFKLYKIRMDKAFAEFPY